MSALTAGMTPGQPDPVPISQRGPAPKHVVVGFGFWIFLLSDIVMFAAIFAAYAVLSKATAGGPSGKDLFDQDHALIETALLLFSSFACGLMMLAAEQRKAPLLYAWATATFLLGTGFLAMELSEFAGMVAQGAGPGRSAFLSAFFMLVGTHGLHVAFGLLWLVAMVLQVATLGFRPMVMRRLLCFSLFWHALDIVWVALFTTVYLLGAR